MNTTTTSAPGLDAAAVRTNPMCGPLDRLPTRYRGPHRLSHGGWLDFAGRLERREEISLVCAATAGNRRVLDVGGGTGELTRAVAVQLGHCTTVEPHSQRVATLEAHAEAGTIEIVPGRAESLPFADSTFDAVIATWILPYVDDLAQSVREMARVCDVDHPEAKIVLIGGAPDNELVNILNQACVPLAGEPHDHQGFLLAAAAEVLADQGFPEFALLRTEAALHFPEADLDDRVRAASTTLVNFWYEGHPESAAMRRATEPVLREHFERRPHAIGDQGTILVARPRRYSPT